MMPKLDFLVAVVLFLLPLSTLGQEDGNTRGSDEMVFNYNNTYKYETQYKVVVNKYTEYIMEFAGGLRSYDTPARVTVASSLANRTYPLFITARQQKGVFSWQLPMLVETPTSIDQFMNISRTLCPHNNLFNEHVDSCELSNQNTPIIHLTSASPDDIEVIIYVEPVKNFYISLNTYTNITLTPSEPQYYFYPFKNLPNNDLTMQIAKKKYVCNEELEFDEKRKLEMYVGSESVELPNSQIQPKSVILMIESDDDLCAVVSIQNYSCPVFDNERDILYDGYYLTMTRRGGITLTLDKFPLGFYIVFIVKSSDEDCVASDVTNSTLPSFVEYFSTENKYIVETSDGRVKSFSFTIVETISYEEYMIGAGVAFIFFFLFYLIAVISIIVQMRYKRNVTTDCGTEEGQLIVPATPHDARNVTTRRRHTNCMDASTSSTQASRQTTSQMSTNGVSSSSDTESELSTLADNDREVYRFPSRLCVANLSRKRPRVLTARTKMYLWNIITISVFYTLPVIQLVVTYQRMLNQSGNQDLCYYNYFCAHPLYVLSDFNHVYSNLGYVLLGLLFLLLVWRRQAVYKTLPGYKRELGIPQHFGLFYAMGVALVSEGILSAAYHVCPNSMNFQFDTSFMYVTGVLCMVKIYQSRHADINARAHATLAVLALIIFIGLVGVLNANLYFWIAFTILHLTTCFIMTFQIYYMGRFRLDGGVIYRAARELVTRPLAAITPTYVARCILLFLANLANWALAAYGVAQHSKDFASHLLLVLMSNLFLYTLFYIAMKLLNKESIKWYSWLFIVLTYTTWFSSSYFFLDQSTNWALTPAQSRRWNKVCTFLRMYDAHDAWHFMSAAAMFFSFVMYLTIDDNLANVSRTEIMVF